MEAVYNKKETGHRQQAPEVERKKLKIWKRKLSKRKKMKKRHNREKKTGEDTTLAKQKRRTKQLSGSEKRLKINKGIQIKSYCSKKKKQKKEHSYLRPMKRGETKI